MASSVPSLNLLDPNHHTLSSGVILHRVHSNRYSGNAFNDRKDVGGRFNPIFDPNGEVVPVLYATDSFESAVYETIFHDVSTSWSEKIIRKFLVTQRNHSTVYANRDISLVSLRNPDLKKWGISRNDLIASPPESYPHTVKWAQEIYNQFINVQGLVWTSNQCDPDSAFMFFGDRIPENSFELGSVREGKNDFSLLNDVAIIGQRSNISIID